jgi:hemerythrin-like domain-containing protein
MTAANAPAPRAPRTPRDPRPPAPPLPEFEKLDQAHRAALEMLQAFDRLIEHLDERGLDDTARASAREILSFFNGPGRDHHAQEESQVFPLLVASGDAELVLHVHRLKQDHGWMEEDWRELSPQIEGIAAGYNWYDLAMLRNALPIYKALHRDHIAFEESVVYPAARTARTALNDGEKARSA